MGRTKLNCHVQRIDTHKAFFFGLPFGIAGWYLHHITTVPTNDFLSSLANIQEQIDGRYGGSGPPGSVRHHGGSQLGRSRAKQASTHLGTLSSHGSSLGSGRCHDASFSIGTNFMSRLNPIISNSKVRHEIRTRCARTDWSSCVDKA